MFISDFERDKRWVRTFIFDADKPDVAAETDLEP
jgi:hypothetical protein